MLLNGKAPLPGQIVQLPNLARTFREVVAKGKDGFYKGRVAQAIVNLIQSKGGVMELEDLANHKSTMVEPIKYTYANEVTVYEVKRFYSTFFTIFNSASAPQMDKASLSKLGEKFVFRTCHASGITALLALGILENIQEQGLSRPLLEMEHNSPEYLHTLIESLR